MTDPAKPHTTRQRCTGSGCVQVGCAGGSVTVVKQQNVYLVSFSARGALDLLRGLLGLTPPHARRQQGRAARGQARGV
ncbi:MAG: hypothetical protein Q4F13_06755 [Pseudomonadota bacterium]|nr:hypothetical protein [Pseudomonadota bacterium]